MRALDRAGSNLRMARKSQSVLRRKPHTALGMTMNTSPTEPKATETQKAASSPALKEKYVRPTLTRRDVFSRSTLFSGDQNIVGGG